MTNENLKIKAQFFGAHIGCMMSYNLQYPERYSSLLGLDIKAERCLVNDADWKDVWWPMRHCKLILRQLSDITESEAIEFARIANENVYHEVRRYDSFIVVENEMVNEWDVYIGIEQLGVWGQDGASLKNDIAAYDYLRSQNFALPFCGVDPIQACWAILQSKSQPQG